MGESPEVVRNQETGFLVPLFATESYIQAVDTLLMDKGLRRKMGQAGQAYVRKAHDLDQNYQQLEMALVRVAGEQWMESHAGDGVQTENKGRNFP